MARTPTPACQSDLACFRNDGHTGEHAYATPDTTPQPAAPAEGLAYKVIDKGGSNVEVHFAPAEGLDVERLARALMRAIPVPASYEEWQATIDRSYYDDAAAIAREYAAIKEASE